MSFAAHDLLYTLYAGGCLLFGVEAAWLHVALKDVSVSQLLFGQCHGGAPVYTKDIEVAIDLIEEGRYAFGEHNDRDVGVFGLEMISDLYHILPAKLIIVAWLDRCSPAIKDLYDIDTRFDLLFHIVLDHFSDLGEDLVEQGRVGVHHFLADVVGLGTLSFDHVGRQCPGCTGKANEGFVLCQLFFDDINFKFYRILRQFAPFGPGNLAPLFVSTHVIDTGFAKIVGKNGQKHLKFEAVHTNHSGNPIKAIAFNLGDFHEEISGGRPFKICYHLDENNWLGNTSLQLRVKDIKIL